jgi:hypothetical protein
MELQKAWDKAALVDYLKAQGLPLAEDVAEKLVTGLFDWVDASLVLEGGMVLAIGEPASKALRTLAMKQADKIDGVEG